MRGLFITLFSLAGLVCFTWLMLTSQSLTFFWLYIELMTLSAVPLFFVGSDSPRVLSGLFSYLVASSIASSLMLSGFLYMELMFMALFGFLLKFGLFPMWGWVYKVGLNSNWFVLWVISTFLKFPIFFFPFFLLLGDSSVSVVYGLSSLSLLILSLLFWFYNNSWFHSWCHMMLSSSAALLSMSLVVPMDVLFYVFVAYVVWSSLVIWFFYVCGEDALLGILRYFWFCFLLIAMPVSLSIFYKLLMVSGIYSCWFVVLVSWVVYSVSEQFWLMKYVMSYELPKSGFGAVGVV